MNLALASVLVLSLTVSALAPSSAVSPSSSSTKQEQNKAVARRVFDQILNQGKFQVADEIYARDFINHGLHRNFSLDEDQAAARWEKTVAPDLTVTVDLIAAEGDLVTVVWTARGTQTVRSGWLPATGVKIEERGITVWRILDGKIHDEWTSFDQFHILRQAVSQLKWILIGTFCVLIFLFWLLGRLISNSLRHGRLLARS